MEETEETVTFKVCLDSEKENIKEVDVVRKSSISELVKNAAEIFNIQEYEEYCLKYANSETTYQTLIEGASIETLFLPDDTVLIFAKKDNFVSSELQTDILTTNSGPQTALSNPGPTTAARMSDLGLTINTANKAVDINYQFTAVGQDAMENNNENQTKTKEDQKLISVLVSYEFDTTSSTRIEISPISSYRQTLTKSCNALGIEQLNEFSMLLQLSDTESVWFDSEHFLEDYSVFDGLKLRIFRRKISFQVVSPHFVSTPMILDVTKTVKDIVKEIAEEKQIPYFQAYSIFSTSLEKGKLMSLEPGKCLAEQVPGIVELTFMRRCFVFSRANLFSMRTAEIAFTDIVNECKRTKVYMNEKQAIEYASYVYAVEHSDILNIDEIPQQMKPYLPKKYKGKKDIGDKVKEFLKSYVPDKINCIRLLIRLMRYVPGFGTELFSAKFREGELKDKLHIQTGPLRLLIINSETDTVLDEIYYHQIIEVTCSVPFVVITFSTPKKEIKTYDFRCSARIASFVALINEYIAIHNFVKVEKATLIEEGKWNGPTGKDEKVILICSTTRDAKEVKALAFSKNITGRSLMAEVHKKMRLKETFEDERILIQQINGSFSWVEPGQVLSHYLIRDESPLFLLRTKVPIQIIMTNQRKVNLVIDIKKPVSELMETIFDSFNLKFVFGFALWAKSTNGRLFALDPKLPIPIQAAFYDQLVFKRRYFQLSRDDLATPALCSTAFYDCYDYIAHNKIKLDDQQAAALAFDILYATISDPNIVSKMKTFDYSLLFPTMEKPSQKAIDQFKKMIESPKRPDSFISQKNFIKHIRTVPMFGSEVFHVTYSKNGKGSFTGKLYCCPLNLLLTEGKEKPIKIPWNCILSCQPKSGVLSICFIISNGEMPVKYDFFTKEAFYIGLFINGCVKNYHLVLKERHQVNAKFTEEAGLRLEGKWIDADGTKHGKQNNFYLSTSVDKIGGLNTKWFDLSETKESIMPKLIKALKLNTEVEYSLLLRFAKTKTYWINDGETLAQYNPPIFSFLFCIQRYQEVFIQSTLAKGKTIKLDVTLPIKTQINHIAQELGLEGGPGYTLYKPAVNEKKAVPLDIERSIGEQTGFIDNLVFKRRFFTILSQDIESKEKMKQLYFESREQVLSGNATTNEEQAITLAAISLLIDTNLNFKSVPDDASSLLPKDFKQSRTTSKLIKKATSQFSFKTADEAVKKYVSISSKLPKYGAEEFTINLSRGSQGVLTVVPDGFSLQSQDEKSCVAFVPMTAVSKVLTVEKDISIEFSNKPEKVFYITGTTERSGTIKSLIKTYLNLTRIEFTDETAEKRGLNVESFDTGIEIAKMYSEKLTMGDFVPKAARDLKLPIDAEYYGLIKKSKATSEWLNDDMKIGNLICGDNAKIIIFSKYTQINVTFNGKTEKIFVDIYKPLGELIETIANRFFIDTFIGYSLFYTEKGKEIPLDYGISIPEQCDARTKFQFKRRIFVMTQLDIDSSLFTEQIYNDFRDEVMKGQAKAEEAEMLEAAVYQMIAECDDPSTIKSQQMTTDIKQYLPPYYKPKEQYALKIYETLQSSPEMSRHQAMKNYIATVRNYKYFGVEYFKGTAEKGTQKATIYLVIGPFGFQIQMETGKGMVETSRFGFSNVLKIESTAGRLQLIYLNQTFQQTYIKLFTTEGAKIKKLVDNYTKVFDLLKQRTELQKSGLISPAEAKVNDDEIGLLVSRQLGYPRKFRIGFKNDATTKQVCDTIGHLFSTSIPDGSVNFIRHENGEYTWQKGDQTLVSCGAKDGDSIISLPNKQEVFIYAVTGAVIRQKVSLSITAGNLTEKIADALGRATPDGSSLYVLNKKNAAIDPETPLILINDFAFELSFKRRFFAFTKKQIADAGFLSDYFQECKAMFLKGQMDAGDAIPAMMAFILITELPKSTTIAQAAKSYDLELLLPRGTKLTSQITTSFQAIAKQVSALTKEEAMRKFISTSAQQKGYGVEEYEVQVTDNQNKSEDPDRPLILALGPFNFGFASQKGRTLISCPWSRLISSVISNNTLVMKFISDDHRYCDCVIKGEHLEQMQMFIAQMMKYAEKKRYLLTVDEAVRELTGQDTTAKRLRYATQLAVDPEAKPITEEEIKDETFYHGSLKSIQQASLYLSQIAVLYKSLSTQEELASAKSLIRMLNEGKVQIKKAACIVGDRARKLASNIALENIRDDALYKCMKAKMCIDAVYYILEKAKKEDYKFDGFEEFKDLRNKFTFATLTISSMSITPSNMKSVNEKLDKFFESVQGKYEEIINEIKPKADNIKTLSKKLPSNTVDPKTVKGIQADLVEIRMKLDSAREVITDPMDSLGLDRLMIIIDETLMEIIPTEERAEHILAFHQAQSDVAVLLEQVFESSKLPEVMSSPELMGLVPAVSSFVHKSYFELTEARKQLNAKPYDEDVLLVASKALKQTSKFVGVLTQLSDELKERAKSNILEKYVTKYQRTIKLTKNLIDNVEQEEFRPRPSIETQVVPAIVLLTDLLKKLEGNPEEEFFKKTLKAMQWELQQQDPLFYSTAARAVSRLDKMGEGFKEELSRLRSAAKVPSITIKLTNEHVKGLILPVNAFYEGIKAFRKKVHSKDFPDAVSELSEWTTAIAETLEVIEKHVNINEFSFLNVDDDLQNIKILMEKIETIPPSVHQVFTPTNSVQLGKSLGETSFVCALANYCLSNIPKFCAATVDNKQFYELDPNKGIDGLNALSIQMMIFQDVLSEITKSPALINYTQSLGTINKMYKAIKKALADLEKMKNGESVNPVITLSELEAVFTPNVDYIKEIEDILKIENLLYATDTILKNITIAKNLLIEMARVAQKLAEYPQKVFPVAQQLMMKISGLTLETDSMKNKLNTMKSLFGSAAGEYPAAKPNEKQSIVDKVYLATTELLEATFDSDVFEPFLLDLIDFIKVSSPFATFPYEEISFTAVIGFKKSPVHGSEIKSAVDDLIAYYKKETDDVSQVTQTINYLTCQLEEFGGDLPRFINQHVTPIRENIITDHEEILPIALNALIVSRSDYSFRVTLLTKLITSLFSRAASCLLELNRTLSLYQQQYADGMTKNENHALAAARKAIKAVDLRLLIDCSTLPVDAMLLSKLVSVEDALCKLLIISEVNTIVDDVIEFVRLFFTCNLLLRSLFFVYCDQIALTLFEIVSDCNKQELNDMIYKFCKVLRHERINGNAKTFLEVIDVYNELISMNIEDEIPESPMKSELKTVVNWINLIKPLIKKPLPTQKSAALRAYAFENKLKKEFVDALIYSTVIEEANIVSEGKMTTPKEYYDELFPAVPENEAQQEEIKEEELEAEEIETTIEGEENEAAQAAKELLQNISQELKEVPQEQQENNAQEAVAKKYVKQMVNEDVEKEFAFVVSTPFNNKENNKLERFVSSLAKTLVKQRSIQVAHAQQIAFPQLSKNQENTDVASVFNDFQEQLGFKSQEDIEAALLTASIDAVSAQQKIFSLVSSTPGPLIAFIHEIMNAMIREVDFNEENMKSEYNDETVELLNNRIRLAIVLISFVQTIDVANHDLLFTANDALEAKQMLLSEIENIAFPGQLSASIKRIPKPHASAQVKIIPRVLELIADDSFVIEKKHASLKELLQVYLNKVNVENTSANFNATDLCKAQDFIVSSTAKIVLITKLLSLVSYLPSSGEQTIKNEDVSIVFKAFDGAVENPELTSFVASKTAAIVANMKKENSESVAQTIQNCALLQFPREECTIPTSVISSTLLCKMNASRIASILANKLAAKYPALLSTEKADASASSFRENVLSLIKREAGIDSVEESDSTNVYTMLRIISDYSAIYDVTKQTEEQLEQSQIFDRLTPSVKPIKETVESLEEMTKKMNILSLMLKRILLKPLELSVVFVDAFDEEAQKDAEEQLGLDYFVLQRMIEQYQTDKLSQQQLFLAKQAGFETVPQVSVIEEEFEKTSEEVAKQSLRALLCKIASEGEPKELSAHDSMNAKLVVRAELFGGVAEEIDSEVKRSMVRSLISSLDNESISSQAEEGENEMISFAGKVTSAGNLRDAKLMIAGVASSLVRLIPTFKSMENEDVESINKSSTQIAVENLRKMLYWTELTQPPQIALLLSAAPHLLASMSIVSPETSIAETLSLLRKLVVSSIDLSDNAKSLEFYKAVLELLKQFTNNEEKSSTEEEQLYLLSEIVKSIRQRNSTKLVDLLIQRESMKNSNEFIQVQGADEFLSDRSVAEEAYTQRMKLPESFLESAQDSLTAIIETVCSMSKDEFKEQKINHRREENNENNMTALFRNASCIASLIYSSRCRSEQSVIDFASSFSIAPTVAVAALQNKSRHSQRSISHLASSILEIGDDELMPEWSAEKEQKIDALKLNLMTALIGIEGIASSAVSQCLSSVLPEVYTNNTKQGVQKIPEIIGELKSSVEELKQENKNQLIAEEFNKVVERIISLAEQFAESAPAYVAIEQRIESIKPFADAVVSLLSILPKMTETAPPVIDAVSASRLPQFIVAVPSQASDLEEEKKSVEGFINEFKEINIVNGTNEELVENLNKAAPIIANIAQHILGAATVASDIDSRLKVSNVGAKCASEFNNYIGEIRSKFLLSSVNTEAFYQEKSEELSKLLDSSLEVLQEAIQVEESQKTKPFAIQARELLNARLEVEHKKLAIVQADSYLARQLTLDALSLFSQILQTAEESIIQHQAEEEQCKPLVDLVAAFPDVNAAEEPENALVEFLTTLETTTASIESCKQLLRKIKVLKGTCEAALTKRRNAKKGKEAADGIAEKVTQQRGRTHADILEMLTLESNVIKARTLLQHTEKKIQGL